MVHPGLRWLEGSAEGRAWLARLPGVMTACAEAWSLRIGEAFPYASASLALAVTRKDGSPAVLKVQFPHRESDHEADALRVWNGRGAVRLLAHDSERHALLLERCEPGTALSELGPDAALNVLVELLPELWVPAGEPFRGSSEEAAWWAEYLPRHWKALGEPFERELMESALAALEELPPSQGEQVLVNQDLHADNVLRTSREPWLVIDPKPLLGEREIGIAALVRGGELGEGRRSVEYRLDRLTADLGLDRERARRWTLAQTLAWGIDEDGVIADHVEMVRWLHELER